MLMEISNKDFIEYGLNDIIFVPNDKVKNEWEILKNKVYSNQEVYIRGMGRGCCQYKIYV